MLVGVTFSNFFFHTECTAKASNVIADVIIVAQTKTGCLFCRDWARLPPLSRADSFHLRVWAFWKDWLIEACVPAKTSSTISALRKTINVAMPSSLSHVKLL